MTVFEAFEENKEAFQDQEFQKRFWNVQEERKQTLTEGKITPSIIFSFINDNYHLVEEALKIDIKKQEVQEDIPSEASEEIAEIIKRNKFQRIGLKDSLFKTKLLENAKTEMIPYPEFEKKILYYLEGMINLSGKELLEEASKAFIWSVYKEDEIKSYRLIFEEFYENNQNYEKLGASFSYPEISISLGRNVSQMMDVVHQVSLFIGGVLGLRRIISIANRIAEVSFSEEEIVNFFSSYLSGGLDLTLSDPPEGRSYFREVVRTYDYDFTTNLDNLISKLEFKPQELEIIFLRFLQILMRVKIIEWSKNVPMGEEITILDLIEEIQRDVLQQIKKKEKVLSLYEMFQSTEKNILESAVNYFSNKMAYSYILSVRRGGIEKALLDSFKTMNLSGASKAIGNQIIDIRNYNEVLYPNSWQEKFFYDFILDIASKGLSTSPKQTVRERLNLLVQESPKHAGSSSYSLKKVESDVVFEILSNKVPLLLPVFSTPEEAQKYFNRTFSAIRSVLNKVWIKKILKSGFELYIESPVKQVWQNEMEDLSRELISYYQNEITVLGKKPSEINQLIFESLRESLSGLYYVNEYLKDVKIIDIVLKLPENPIITHREDVENYLDNVFEESKVIINEVLGREVKEEVERKTFDQEIEERISLENIVIDWFVRTNQYYNSIITESISLEKTTNPTDVLLKTIYGGVIFLVEESMKSLMLNYNDKINKANFLKTLLQKQIEALRNTFSQFNFDYNIQTIIDYVLDQIKLWDKVFSLRGVLADLEADNRVQQATRSINISEYNRFKESEIFHPLIGEPGIRGLVARELITEWIRSWGNSVINLAESYLEDIFSNIKEGEREDFEQKVLGLLFRGSGRDNIRNFMVPLIVGNLKEPLGFETTHLSPEFLDYSHEVFSEAVKCDSQLSTYFLYLNWSNIGKEKIAYRKKVTGDLDFIIYQENRIESCRQLLGSTQELNISDVVKKATGLSISGLTLQSVVFQLGESETFCAASYTENPFEGSTVTGLTLELISKENIPMGLLHPLTQNASEVIAGLIERNRLNATEPDSLFKIVLKQLLDEARLVLLKDIGTLRERMSKEIMSQTQRDVSRCNLKVTTAYKMYLKNDCQISRFLPEEVEFYGEKLGNFSLFIQLVFPFFEPSQIIKKRLRSDVQLLKHLEIPRGEEIQVFPFLIIFDDNGMYKVVFGTYSFNENTLSIIVAEENDESKMGLRTIRYLLKTRDFEELTEDLGLLPLPRLNRSLPLNRIKVLKEKGGEALLDIELIKNISFGAI